MNLPTDYTKLNVINKRLVREQYATEQDGKCFYCNTELDKEPHKTKWINLRLFPKGFMNNPIHLHHDHKNGMTLGVVVHAYCNAVLWQYEGE